MPQEKNEGRNVLADTEFPQIKPHHLRLNFHRVELLPIVDSNHAADHLRHHNHVPQVRLHQVRFLVRFGFLLRFAQFLDQAHGFALQAPVEAAAGAGVNDIAELFGGEVEESGLVIVSVGRNEVGEENLGSFGGWKRASLGKG